MDTNPSAPVTRADLAQQLEIHAKAIELSIQISNQQAEVIEKLGNSHTALVKVTDILEQIERRTWKQTWLLWGVISALLTAFGVPSLLSSS